MPPTAISFQAKGLDVLQLQLEGAKEYLPDVIGDIIQQMATAAADTFKLHTPSSYVFAVVTYRDNFQVTEPVVVGDIVSASVINTTRTMSGASGFIGALAKKGTVGRIRPNTLDYLSRPSAASSKPIPHTGSAPRNPGTYSFDVGKYMAGRDIASELASVLLSLSSSPVVP